MGLNVPTLLEKNVILYPPLILLLPELIKLAPICFRKPSLPHLPPWSAKFHNFLHTP